jgi:hypothetical protein
VKLRRRGGIAVDDVVDLADVYGVAVAMNIRHRRRHLDDERFGAFDQRPVPDSSGTEVDPAILVHWAGLEANEIDRVDETPVIVRDFAEVERNVVADSGVVLAVGVAAEVPVERVKMLPVGIGFPKHPRGGET